jgi:hypothetical protein
VAWDKADGEVGWKAWAVNSRVVVMAMPAAGNNKAQLLW